MLSLTSRKADGWLLSLSKEGQPRVELPASNRAIAAARLKPAARGTFWFCRSHEGGASHLTVLPLDLGDRVAEITKNSWTTYLRERASGAQRGWFGPAEAHRA